MFKIYRTDERRHKCPVEGCNKRYKNLQGARYHARQVHGYTEDNGANSAVSFDLTAVVPGQVAPLIQSGAPSKYAKFVVFCERIFYCILERLMGFRTFCTLLYLIQIWLRYRPSKTV